MATRKKKVVDEDYSKLDQYAIELHEFYKSLRKAGFSNDNALWMVATKDSYPEWVSYREPNETDIANLLDEDED